MAMMRGFSALLVVVCLFGTCMVSCAQATIVGGPKDIDNFANSVEIDELANFAVDQYKTRQNLVGDMSFSRVLSAREQVVQGTMYYLTIEVMEGGVAKQYDAKVWVKPWEAYKELESFLPSAPTHYDPAVDVSAKLDALSMNITGASDFAGLVMCSSKRLNHGMHYRCRENLTSKSKYSYDYIE